MTRFRVRAFGIAVALTALTVLAVAPSSSASPSTPRLIEHRGAIPGRYIVVLRSGSVAASPRGASLAVTSSLVAEHGGHVVAHFGALFPRVEVEVAEPALERINV